jgi:hypothetical protein
MSNQRSPNMNRPTMMQDGISITAIKSFAAEAERLLENDGQADAAFYFGQLADYITKYPEKGLSDSVGRILGI